MDGFTLALVQSLETNRFHSATSLEYLWTGGGGAGSGWAGKYLVAEAREWLGSVKIRNFTELE